MDSEKNKFIRQVGKGPYYPHEEGYLKAPVRWLSHRTRGNRINPERLEMNPGRSVSRFGIAEFIDSQGRMYSRDRDPRSPYYQEARKKGGETTAFYIKLPRSSFREKQKGLNKPFPRPSETLKFYDPLKQELHTGRIESMWNGFQRTTGVLYVRDFASLGKVPDPQNYRAWYPRSLSSKKKEEEEESDEDEEEKDETKNKENK